MEQVAPLGPAYQAGTMAGNPLSISSGIACLEQLQDAALYERMDRLAARLADGLKQLADEHGIPLTVNRVRGAFSIHFCDHPVKNYQDVERSDGERFAQFFRLMLDQGICLAPSKYEAWFLTAAHTDEHIDQTLEAARVAFRAMQA